MLKKVTSVLLCACMITSYMAVGSIPVQAAEIEAQESKTTTNYGLTSNVQQGQILQCWNWSYQNITANLEKIASQGFSAIQTSPITPSNCESAGYTVANRWWTFYQPTNFAINQKTSNGLGTKADFEEMCEVAHSYGVKVIVDAVLNHMASQTRNDVCLLVPSEIRTNSALWHDMSIDISNYENRYDATQHCMDGLPDLNTANKTVQNYAITYLQECIDAGADGFRFDAAKHIETSYDDSSFSSDYWETVIPTVTSYAQSTRGITPYYYGETLGNLGGGSWAGYTDYMTVTDDGKATDIRDSVQSGSGAGAAVSDIGKGVAPSKALQWPESHDTYISGSTSGISTKLINQTWAVLGSRNQVCGLYFARPDDPSTTMIGDADVTGWANAEVKAVNQFKNHFAGQSEYLASSGSVAYNERGTSGVVIVNCNGGSKTVSLKANKMASGTYKDVITGNSFTVSGGYINGTVGATGIAVVYDANAIENPTTPVTNPVTSGNIYFTPSSNWTDANARFAAYFFNSSGDEAWVSLTKNSDGKYFAAMPSGYSNVIFVRMNPSTTANTWDNKWNQTADLTISGNYFTLTSSDWDNGTGTWSTITEPTEPVTTPVTEPVTVPVTEPVTTPVTVPVTEPVTTPVTEPVTTPVADNQIYFVPSTNWTEANARFAAYFFNGSSDPTWISLTANSDGKYSGTIPTGDYKSVIFVRMNPSTTANTWDNKWNQTADLTINGNCFTLTSTEWDNGNGTWTTIGTPTQPVTEPVTVPTTEPVTTPVTVPVTEPVTVPTTEPITTPVIDNLIYFVPSTNWTEANARFAAYFFNGSSDPTWISLTANSDGKYSGTIPTGDYKSVIFVRMNPSTTANTWDNKWNQTADLTINGNCFTLTSTEWDNGNGTWTTIGTPTQPVTEPVTVPTTEPVTTPVTVPVTEPVTVPTTEPITTPVIDNLIYFVPSTNWTEANARFAAYFFNGSSDPTWISLTANSDGKYSGTIPTGDYKSVIFVRMNPSTTANTWDNKWNQTADLTIDGNCFTLTSTAWDNGTGTWTTINTPTQPATQPVTVPTTQPATTPVVDNQIYFVPSTNWTEANARFAAYFFDGSSDPTWISLTANSDGKYSGTIPTGDYKSVIFVRMNPSTTANTWDNKWNQTADLTINGNCFTLTSTEWDNGNGTWSTIENPTVAPTDESTTPTEKPTVSTEKDGYYVTGDINMKLASCGSNKVSGKIALQAGTYQIKLNNNGTLLGYGKTVTNSSNGMTFKSTYSSFMTLNATGGVYTFQVNADTNTLVIKHDSNLPTNYLTGDINTILTPVAGRTLAIGTTYLEAGTYNFKLSIDNVAFGYGKTVTDKTTGSMSFKNTYSSNATLIATGGTYTFTLNTSTNKLLINHVPAKDEASNDIHLSGDINLVLDDDSGNSDIATGTVTLAEGTYSFRLYNYGQALTAGVRVADSGEKKLFGNYTAPLTLLASGGTYTFTFDKTTDTITIEKA